MRCGAPKGQTTPQDTEKQEKVVQFQLDQEKETKELAAKTEELKEKERILKAQIEMCSAQDPAGIKTKLEENLKTTQDELRRLRPPATRLQSATDRKSKTEKLLQKLEGRLVELESEVTATQKQLEEAKAQLLQDEQEIQQIQTLLRPTPAEGESQEAELASMHERMKAIHDAATSHREAMPPEVLQQIEQVCSPAVHGEVTRNHKRRLLTQPSREDERGDAATAATASSMQGGATPTPGAGADGASAGSGQIPLPQTPLNSQQTLQQQQLNQDNMAD